MRLNKMCPLCKSSLIQPFHQDLRRKYLRCEQCNLVFVEPQFLPSAAQEKSTYDLHQNNPHDLDYRKFLSKLATPLLSKLPPQSYGLDFGCGQGSALVAMLEEAGHKIEKFDPFYANNPQVLAAKYSFITCTEAIEHFHKPAQEWAQLLAMLKPNGILGIMTKLMINREKFAAWHYTHDQTHVSFFSRKTFEFLAQRDNLSLEFVANDAMIFQKK